MWLAIRFRVHLETDVIYWFGNSENIKLNCRHWAERARACHHLSISKCQHTHFLAHPALLSSALCTCASAHLQHRPHTCPLVQTAGGGTSAALDLHVIPLSPGSDCSTYIEIYIKFKIQFPSCIWQILSAQQQHVAGGFQRGDCRYRQSPSLQKVL